MRASSPYGCEQVRADVSKSLRCLMSHVSVVYESKSLRCRMSHVSEMFDVTCLCGVYKQVSEMFEGSEG